MFDSLHGWTCLHYAAYYCHSDCLQVILYAANSTQVADSWWVFKFQQNPLYIHWFLVIHMPCLLWVFSWVGRREYACWVVCSHCLARELAPTLLESLFCVSFFQTGANRINRTEPNRFGSIWFRFLSSVRFDFIKIGKNRIEPTNAHPYSLAYLLCFVRVGQALSNHIHSPNANELTCIKLGLLWMLPHLWQLWGLHAPWSMLRHMPRWNVTL